MYNIKVDWVNCFIDKFLISYPTTSDYVVLLNKWCFEISLSTNGIERIKDLSYSYEGKMLNLYNMKRFSRFDNNYDEVLSGGFNVFMNCDVFYLKHSGDYQKKHMNHYILIRSKDTIKGYNVYDDMPKYQGYISEDEINKLYFCSGKKSFYSWYKQLAPVEVTFIEELNYIKNNIIPSLKISSVFKQLIELDCTNLRKMEICSDLKRHLSLCNSLHRFFAGLYDKIKTQEIFDIYELSKLYTQHLLLITNMSYKGKITNKESFWIKVMERINDFYEIENKLIKKINYFKNELLPAELYRLLKIY